MLLSLREGARIVSFAPDTRAVAFPDEEYHGTLKMDVERVTSGVRTVWKAETLSREHLQLGFTSHRFLLVLILVHFFQSIELVPRTRRS